MVEYWNVDFKRNLLIIELLKYSCRWYWANEPLLYFSLGTRYQPIWLPGRRPEPIIP
jgi:hypothetical protein